MAMRAKMNVQSFPRPPRLDKISRHLQITWNGHVVADTNDAYWVLETHHPPTYYYTVTSPDGKQKVSNRIWSYENPTSGFEPIRGYLSFYAGPWDCFVDGEKVEPQPGDFYGGWVTSEIEGIVKGRHGNRDPEL